MALTAGARVDTLTEALSYDVVSLTRLLPGNAPATGAVSLTVNGAGMASDLYSPTARLGATACEGTTWVADTELVCTLNPHP